MLTTYFGTKCGLTAAFMFLAWWLFASALLFFAWNKVVCEMSKFKQAKYWQALLVVATICAFCIPRLYAKRCSNWAAHNCKTDCPYQQGQAK